jgi:hypothetical protein
MRLAGHQRVAAETWVERRVANLEGFVAQDGIGAEDDLARRLTLTEASAGPELLTALADDGDKGDRDLEIVGHHRNDVIKHIIGGGIDESHVGNA